MFSKLGSVKTWLGPMLIALGTMFLYQFFLSPIVNDLMSDWQFLHAARLQVIQQQLQANQKASEGK